MKTWKPKNNSYLAFFTLLLTLLSVSSTCHSTGTLKLKAGLWEGINSNVWEYNILDLGADGHHRYFRAHIASAFEEVKFLKFSDKQITCSSTECTINIVKKNQAIIRLIITPYLEESFKVLEINANQAGQPVFTQTYQLDSKQERSTVRSFLKSYKGRLASLKEDQSDGIYGFWLGVLELDNKPELISLEVYPDKKSKFSYFVNGSNTIIETRFLPEKMTIDQSLIDIETDHTTFANKILINQLSKSQLSGYMYSVYKGSSLQTGKLSLIRVR